MLHKWEYPDSMQLGIPRCFKMAIFKCCKLGYPDWQLGISRYTTGNIQMYNWEYPEAEQLGISIWITVNIQMGAVSIQMVHSCGYPGATQL